MSSVVLMKWYQSLIQILVLHKIWNQIGKKCCIVWCTINIKFLCMTVLYNKISPYKYFVWFELFISIISFSICSIIKTYKCICVVYSLWKDFLKWTTFQILVQKSILTWWIRKVLFIKMLIVRLAIQPERTLSAKKLSAFLG